MSRWQRLSIVVCMKRCHRTFERPRKFEDWLNLAGLAVLVSISVSGVTATLLFEHSKNMMVHLLGWLVWPCLCSPLVFFAVASAGIASLCKPTRIVVTSWGVQLHYLIGRIDLKKDARKQRRNVKHASRFQRTAEAIAKGCGFLFAYLVVCVVGLLAMGYAAIPENFDSALSSADQIYAQSNF
jgi:hypothetical protein